jgi:excisionase family DNA binding protein
VEDPLLTVSEVATIARVSTVTVRRWIKSRRVVAVKVTDRAGWRMRRSEVERLLRVREPTED